MFYKKAAASVFTFILLVLWLSAGSVPAYPGNSVPNVNQEMLAPDFWVGKLSEPDRVIMSGDEIAAFNKDIINKLPDLVYDLAAYPASLTGEQLTKLVTKRLFPEEDRYTNGQKVDSSYYENLKKQMNLTGIRDKNEVAYAVTVKRADVRTFPTSDASLTEPDDWEFDLFQETAVGPVEPVLVLHRSLDGQWLFVQVYNYCGWMPAAGLAVADSKASWLAYVNPANFLVFTGNRLRLSTGQDQAGSSEVELLMGARAPLSGGADKAIAAGDQPAAGNFTVLLPVRGSGGELVLKAATVPAGSDVSVGYLAYTRANIIRQAFKILDERYGWGGMFNARDCSAFVMDVYRSFGLMLPRNADEQEQSAGKTVKFETLNTKQRYALLDTLLPGASLHTPTHEMLYLGKHEGRYYIIHDVTSIGDPYNKNSDGSLGTIVLNRVAVSDLSLPRRNGTLYIDSLTGGKQIEYSRDPGAPSYSNSVSVFVNGSAVAFTDQKPFIDTSVSRVYVPVRFVSEAMGGRVQWVEKDQKVIIQKGDKRIILTIGDKNVSVNGQGVTLDAPVRLLNDRTLVPLRFVSETLGAQVKWTGSGGGGRVDINY